MVDVHMFGQSTLAEPGVPDGAEPDVPVDGVSDDDEPEEAVVDGIFVAACAATAPPTPPATTMPETASAASPFRIGVMCSHLLPNAAVDCTESRGPR